MSEIIKKAWLDQTFEEYKAQILKYSTTIEQNEVVYKECENLCKFLQKENEEFFTTIESQKEEIERYKQALIPSVVYSAIRHYYKQGLFEPNEYGDIENIMDLISHLQEGKNK